MVDGHTISSYPKTTKEATAAKRCKGRRERERKRELTVRSSRKSREVPGSTADGSERDSVDPMYHQTPHTTTTGHSPKAARPGQSRALSRKEQEEVEGKGDVREDLDSIPVLLEVLHSGELGRHVGRRCKRKVRGREGGRGVGRQIQGGRKEKRPREERGSSNHHLT
jgi:hypothetical protein